VGWTRAQPKRDAHRFTCLDRDRVALSDLPTLGVLGPLVAREPERLVENQPARRCVAVDPAELADDQAASGVLIAA